MALQEESSDTFSSINITPLVDIILVLLIVFMVTARLMTSPSLPIDLPKAASGSETQDILSISVNPEGEIFVGNKHIASDNELIAAAKEASKKTTDLRAVLQADGAVRHERIVHIMDLLRQQGISKLAFGVNPTSQNTQ